MSVVRRGVAARTALILQARMGSTRLPGKSMLDLAGAPLVGRILERVQRCQRPDVIVLAITQKAEDDVLANLAQRYDVVCFRGAEKDLVDRYLRAAEAVGAGLIVRLPADNPCPEPAEIDRIIDYHRRGGVDFSSNLQPFFGSGYPDGIGAEVFDRQALERVWRTGTDPHRREHPHTHFFDYRAERPVAGWRVGTIPCPREFARPDLVLAVNTWEQYQFMRRLYDALYPRNPRFHITDIIAWYDHAERMEIT